MKRKHPPTWGFWNWSYIPVGAAQLQLLPSRGEKLVRLFYIETGTVSEIFNWFGREINDWNLHKKRSFTQNWVYRLHSYKFVGWLKDPNIKQHPPVNPCRGWRPNDLTRQQDVLTVAGRSSADPRKENANLKTEQTQTIYTQHMQMPQSFLMQSFSKIHLQASLYEKRIYIKWSNISFFFFFSIKRKWGNNKSWGKCDYFLHKQMAYRDEF